MKIFLGQNLLLVPLWYDREKNCIFEINENISRTKFIAYLFLILLVKNVV